MRTSALPLFGWRAKAPSNASKLRDLLADGRWHGQQALQRVAGQRFGARIFDLHNNIDVAAGLFPLHYRKRFVGDDDSNVQYRQTDKADCDICTAEARKKPSQVIAELQARVAELEAENARLRGGR